METAGATAAPRPRPSAINPFLRLHNDNFPPAPLSAPLHPLHIDTAHVQKDDDVISGDVHVPDDPEARRIAREFKFKHRPQPPPFHIHRVVLGDTLRSLLLKYPAVDLTKIKKVNKLFAGDTSLRERKFIVIPLACSPQLDAPTNVTCNEYKTNDRWSMASDQTLVVLDQPNQTELIQEHPWLRKTRRQFGHERCSSAPNFF